jgi:hypothetical protein
MEEEKIPTSLQEAIDFLIEADANLGMGSGMGMRNSWGLWHGSKLAQWFYRHQIYHADDMSGIIMDSYKRTKNGEPIELKEQIAKYHKHWEINHGPNHLSEMKAMIVENLIKMRAENLDEILKDINSEDIEGKS